MNGNNIVVDTNVVINQFYGNKQAELLVAGNIVFISAISVIELFSVELEKVESDFLYDYIANINVLHTNDAIVELAAGIRKVYGLKLPDAIIAATAIYLGSPLATADKAFQKIKNILILDYEI